MATTKYIGSIMHVIGWLTRLGQYAALGIAVVRTASAQTGPATGLIQIALAIFLLWFTRGIAVAGLTSPWLAAPLFYRLAGATLLMPFLLTVATAALLVWILR